MSPVEIIRENSTPLSPIPTDTVPVLKTLDGIRAVIFDIYGTLMISAAGDISLVQENASEKAMIRAGGDRPDATSRYHELIARHHSLSDKTFPEVEIREVWRELAGDSADVETMAVTYEVHANPVWPMPHCKEVLQELRNRGLAMGIVSNAQFYTRHLFPALLGNDLETLGFSPDLMIFSYEEREGKPARALYQKLTSRLQEREINPDEALYVGNDMKKDIQPAKLEGLQTALFAGDQRSLRLHPELGVTPDWVITDLVQLIQ